MTKLAKRQELSEMQNNLLHLKDVYKLKKQSYKTLHIDIDINKSQD